LTRLELTASYAIIRHNVRTYQSGGVVEVVRGKQNAESALRNLKESQASADHQEGWRYFFERSDLKAGTNPAEATRLRQATLELRESQALQESETLQPPPISPRR
jgi:hypothetical protein